MGYKIANIILGIVWLVLMWLNNKYDAKLLKLGTYGVGSIAYFLFMVTMTW